MNSVLITGSSSGIGRSISEYFLNAGQDVYGIARRNQDFYQNSLFHSVSLDLTNVKSIEQTLAKLPLENIKIAVLNAGIGYFSPFQNFPTEKIEEIFLINTISQITIARILVPFLLKNHGHIMIVSSMSAEKVSPWGSVYASSKSALSHFGRQISEEYKNENLKVSILSPEIVNTEFYQDLAILPSENPDTYIEASDLVNVLDFILKMKDRMHLQEFHIRTKKFEIKKRKFQNPKTES